MTGKMTATERKSLERLIDNDFDQVLAEVNTLANKAAHDVEVKIRDEYAARSVDIDTATAELQEIERKHADAVLELNRQMQDKRSEVIARYRDDGLTFVNTGRGGSGTFAPAGLDEALAEGRAEVEQRRMAVRTRLNKERSDAHRKVLLGGLESAQALALVEGIPTAEALYALVGGTTAPELEEGK